MPCITCKDASFAYDGTDVISGLNFEVNTGNYVCIVGENGSGKTTLLQKCGNQAAECKAVFRVKAYLLYHTIPDF